MGRAKKAPSRTHRKVVQRRRKRIRQLRARRGWRGLLRCLRIWLFRVALAVFLIVLALRWINPPVTYLMVRDYLEHDRLEKSWRSLDEMTPWLPLAAAAGEDANFCTHHGFDVAAIRAALADERRLRGGSTISQQTAKNVFLWPDRSWLRKGLEAGFTGLIELFWPKARIMEVYLNVAEFDAGVFGVEAAAQHYFGVSADQLSLRQASLLVAILPAPKARSASRPTDFISRRARQIAAGAETLRVDPRGDCLRIPDTSG
ncbi:monofunctional biosynthetic peptidoglycan transglycosylase [Oceanomicrobium pacificus]|uniref:Biosynthetic peptidoglycan transglycosylase n=1 Tax=Oceanomicrobium pacificus TaxID=2692916 RepID=A0A6B0TTX1_9RHOB|nr:monofunctional biosynthetic peptidoglycan transglycosylase [Oceanomicrobium pacificus]MXU64674.1 monofunctional biosynthetic peptidoglycan transglycosylase [Oceanomicrobium pacificus]